MMNRNTLVNDLRVIRTTGEMTLRQAVVSPFIVFTVFVWPFLLAILALWMLQDKSSDNAIYVVVGSGMAGLWSSLLFICGNSVTVERWTGTLEALVATPASITVIVFGKNLANVLLSLISMVICYFVAALMFNYPIRVDQPLLFGISLLLTVIAFVCFGLIMAPLFLLSPAVQNFQNGLEFPVNILAGFLFPIALLPIWTTPLSYLLVPYWAARALHVASSVGGTFGEIAFCWAMLIIFSLIYLIGSRYLFRAVLYRVRVDATLGLE
jgi:ABC-2 type transport system permease protein